MGLNEADDPEVLDWANTAVRTVVTHDRGFSALVTLQGLPHSGVILLRPGHRQPLPVIRQLAHVLDFDLPEGPFIVSVTEQTDGIHLRVRET